MLKIIPVYIIFIINIHLFLDLPLVVIRIKCALEPDVVGHLRSFQLLFYEYCEYYSFHILFFTYYIVCSFGCSQKPLLIFNFVACALRRSHLLAACFIQDESFQKKNYCKTNCYSSRGINYLNFFLTLKCNDYISKMRQFQLCMRQTNTSSGGHSLHNETLLSTPSN